MNIICELHLKIVIRKNQNIRIAYNLSIWVQVTVFMILMDREAWRAVIHGVAKSQTRLSNWTDAVFKISDKIIFREAAKPGRGFELDRPGSAGGFNTFKLVCF